METVIDNVEGEHSNSFKSYYVVWKPQKDTGLRVNFSRLNRTM